MSKRQPTGGTNGNKFADKLHKLFSELEELGRDTDGLQAYAKLCENQSTLRQNLERKEKEIQKRDAELRDLAKEKDDEIARLQKDISESKDFRERLGQDYNTKFKAWDADSQRHSNDSARISQLEHELEESRKATEEVNNKCQQLRSSLNRHTKQKTELEEVVESLKIDCQKKGLELKETKKELEKCEKRLKIAKLELGFLPLDPQEL
jgi:chromosome segregation ATPase